MQRPCESKRKLNTPPSLLTSRTMRPVVVLVTIGVPERVERGTQPSEPVIFVARHRPLASADQRNTGDAALTRIFETGPVARAAAGWSTAVLRYRGRDLPPAPLRSRCCSERNRPHGHHREDVAVDRSRVGAPSRQDVAASPPLESLKRAEVA